MVCLILDYMDIYICGYYTIVLPYKPNNNPCNIVNRDLLHDPLRALKARDLIVTGIMVVMDIKPRGIPK